MKIALVGYGKMGHLIAQLAPQVGIEVGPTIDLHDSITAEAFKDVDVAIEFSTPEAVVHNIEQLAALKVNTVVGTTGWAKDFDRVRKLVEDSGIGLVWSPNYSIGVQVFSRLVAEARSPAQGPAGIRRMGLGDSPRYESRRSIGYIVETGWGHEVRRVHSKHRC